MCNEGSSWVTMWKFFLALVSALVPVGEFCIGVSFLLFVTSQRGYPSRSPSPGNYPDYGGGASASFDPLYPLGGFHHKAAPPPPPLPPAPSYSGGGGRSQRGITTATSMIISNLSDTVSKNDVAVSKAWGQGMLALWFPK